MTNSTLVPVKTNHRRKAMLGVTYVFAIIAVLWLLYWLIWGQYEVYTDDAYVNGNIVQLMSQVPGTIVEINTDETQLVTQGQVVVKLDPADMSIALARAEANLADTVRQVRKAFEDAERAQADLILANSDLMKAQLDIKRRTKLVGISAVSKEDFQHYQTALKNAQARYDYALHNLRSLQSIVENTHLYTHPMVERAKANYKTAFLNLKRTTITAPVTGYVAKKAANVGQQIKENSAILAIIPLTEIWVDANYKESQLTYLRIDQPVTLTADAYPGVTYHGKIFGLNAGTGAAFALLPPQNATGNWIKIVQRLAVRIKLDPEEIKKYPLQLGLSMRVTTNIHDVNGNMLAQTALNKPVYTTNVYAEQLDTVDTIIQNILQDNAPNLYMSRVTTDV